MDKEEIRKEAKKIMDNFMNSLKDIEVEENYQNHRDNSLRQEGEVINDINKEDFKNRFLSNAPKVSGDSILANKGEWEE
jgi:SpoVK/Ycf46/Vps4 family AAA+-type ATPase